MDSCLAAWMKPQVFTSTTLASSAGVSSQPDAVSRAASSSESTSLRAQPSVTRLTVRRADAGRGATPLEDTPRAYPGGQLDWLARLGARGIAGDGGAWAEAQGLRLGGGNGLALAV